MNILRKRPNCGCEVIQDTTSATCPHCGSAIAPYERTLTETRGKVGEGSALPQSPTCRACRFDIPVGGPEDAILREELAGLWGVPDRRVRKIIEGFRETDSGDPYPILSTSSGAGYWRSDDVKEMERFAAEMAAKARGHFGALREVRRAIRRENTKGQMTIDEMIS